MELPTAGGVEHKLIHIATNCIIFTEQGTSTVKLLLSLGLFLLFCQEAGREKGSRGWAFSLLFVVRSSGGLGFTSFLPLGSPGFALPPLSLLAPPTDWSKFKGETLMGGKL